MRLIFNLVPLAVAFPVALLGCSASPQLAPNQLVADDVYSAIRTDGTFVYYVDDVRDSTDHAHFRFVRVSVAGGEPEPLAELPSPLNTATSFAAFVIDATTAYCPVDGAIIAIPLSGGAPVTLVDEGAELVQALTADETTLYWVEGPDSPPWGLDTRLVTIPKVGGVPTVLVSTGASLGASTTQIAVDGTNVYWPSATCDTSAPPDCVFYNTIINSTNLGGASSVWASAQANVQAIATDGTSLYWLTADHGPSNGELLRAPIAAATNVTTLAQGIASPWSSTPQAWGIQIADAATVLWLDATGSVYSIKNGQPAVVADGDGTGPIKFFTTDSVNIYWATSSGVFRTAR